MADSKYQQIKSHILQRIETGRWQEGDAVPSENQLAGEFGVSRMTARRALQELAEQGVLQRTQGAATCVAPLKSQSSMLQIRNIADEIRERQHNHSAQVIELAEIQADNALAAHFALPVGSQLYYSLICHWQDDEPLQLEQRFVNPALAPDYLEQDFSTLTPHEYLCTAAPLTEAEHKVEAMLADALSVQYLQLQVGAPCLRLHRTTWSRDGVVSHALLTHPGEKYQLGGHLTFVPSERINRR
ncbi:histidine utilization repressor [Bowmanella yangjiangensis]|uniref:Histidine utilization repressor n=1 Tax=Bowmanella yangjiangensis TaxID=2811230 RepID=A0ABS3CQ46_9ALTE|nr:histidine utilization repressor [Bowmanella yangjiangensis]MBN7819228.1 histidine utilization repressor [Bowmanella yangjiangensis]